MAPRFAVIALVLSAAAAAANAANAAAANTAANAAANAAAAVTAAAASATTDDQIVLFPGGPSRETSASRSLRRALSTPQANPGSRYRCGEST